MDQNTLNQTTASLPLSSSARPARTAVTVYEECSDFVWRSLQRLGVREADLEDVFQEVFVVVHNRISVFDERSKLTTWLFGVCLRVASAYRRRAYRRREQPMEDVPESEAGEQGPEDAFAARQAQWALQSVLDRMDLEKRAVFVMFEIDELSSESIAQMLGVPVGTVYSRLHAARKQFQQLLAEHRCTPRNGGEP